MRQVFVAVVGHNASGKTFIAEKLEQDLGFNRVSADDFRLFVSEHISYFHNLDISIKNERFTQLTDLSLRYRSDMSWLLLDAGQNVIHDGGGATKAWRAEYLNHAKKYRPEALRVLLYVDISEEELLKRLAARGGSWQQQYFTNKRELFEPPTTDEADALLVYNQHNYNEILTRMRSLLEKSDA